MTTRDARLTALILPGLDGTGLLLADFVAALTPHFDPVIVGYPTHQPLDYDGLYGLIQQSLPAGDFVVIGESFSGPLALRIATVAAPGLKAVVLGASFARLDLPAKGLLSWFARPSLVRIAPTLLLTPWLLGKWSSSQRRVQLASVLARLRPDVLALRARAALSVDMTTRGRIDVPLLYLRASEDRLVPKAAADVVAALASQTTIRDIAAPHFLFQIAPEQCAEAVAAFCRATSGDERWAARRRRAK